MYPKRERTDSSEQPIEEQMFVTCRPMKALLEVEWCNPLG